MRRSVLQAHTCCPGASRVEDEEMERSAYGSVLKQIERRLARVIQRQNLSSMTAWSGNGAKDFAIAGYRVTKSLSLRDRKYSFPPLLNAIAG